MTDNSPFNIKQVLVRLSNQERLDKVEACDILTAIGEGKVNPSQIASFVTCFNMRPITGEELTGFREAMINLAIAIDFSDLDTIDVCGTGGDGKNTFNISTTSAFVIAGVGYKVAKHGNYGVSSGCGSSNVLEYLGYQMSNNYDKLRAEIERSNFCYMHAPLFHPAMKEVGPIRKELQVKTFFNMLGPLLNPSLPKRQITGVFSEELMPLYQSVFENINTNYAIIRSKDGYDEISLTGAFRMVTHQDDKVIYPADIGLENIQPEELHGGNNIEEAATTLRNILDGNGSQAQNDVVCANAGIAIQRFKPEASLEDCIAEAREALVAGKAKRTLDQVIGG